jgi:hypothetical protein
MMKTSKIVDHHLDKNLKTLDPKGKPGDDGRVAKPRPMSRKRTLRLTRRASAA